MIPKQIIIHHSDSSRDKTTIEKINEWHKLRWPDSISSLGYYIGYHWVITGDGITIQTRRNQEMGMHCVLNDGRIGICLTGRFQEEKPSETQLNSLERLLGNLKTVYQLQDKDIFGHCEKVSTICPGKNLMDWIKLYRQISVLQQLILYYKNLIEKLGLKRSQ